MATSIKLSELQSLTNLTPTDLFLVTDSETSSSRKVSYETLKADTITGLEATITNLIGDAPETLNQLSELADALQDNPNILSELQAAVASNDIDIENEVAARGVAVTGEQTAREQAVAALQALIDSLQAEAASRLTRIEALEADPTTAAALSAVQADVDQNEADSDAAEAALALRLDALESDPTTAAALSAVQADVDQNEADADAAIAAETAARVAAISALQADVDQNEADSDAAETALDTRVTSLETTVNNLDIDIAPETLNSINELAAAMGDDPTFLTTLQARVSVIENDNATQTELDEYKAHIEARNLEAGLATGVLYADTIYGG